MKCVSPPRVTAAVALCLGLMALACRSSRTSPHLASPEAADKIVQLSGTGLSVRQPPRYEFSDDNCSGADGAYERYFQFVFPGTESPDENGFLVVVWDPAYVQRDEFRDGPTASAMQAEAARLKKYGWTLDTTEPFVEGRESDGFTIKGKTPDRTAIWREAYFTLEDGRLVEVVGERSQPVLTAQDVADADHAFAVLVASIAPNATHATPERTPAPCD